MIIEKQAFPFSIFWPAGRATGRGLGRDGGPGREKYGVVGGGEGPGGQRDGGVRGAEGPGREKYGAVSVAGRREHTILYSKPVNFMMGKTRTREERQENAALFETLNQRKVIIFKVFTN